MQAQARHQNWRVNEGGRGAITSPDLFANALFASTFVPANSSFNSPFSKPGIWSPSGRSVGSKPRVPAVATQAQRARETKRSRFCRSRHLVKASPVRAANLRTQVWEELVRPLVARLDVLRDVAVGARDVVPGLRPPPHELTPWDQRRLQQIELSVWESGCAGLECREG